MPTVHMSEKLAATKMMSASAGEATRHARRNAWRIAKVSVWAFFASVSRGPSKKGPDPSAAD